MYRDPLNRDALALRLNHEAMKAFSDTVAVSRRHELAAEYAEFKTYQAEDGFATGGFVLGAAMIAQMEYMNYEHLKIASGFELHLKARLIASDFLVHKIDSRHQDYKTLAKEQKDRPINKTELFAIRGYHFDGHLNYLPGLTEKSLDFSQLTTKKNYKAILNLPDEDIHIIEYFRCLRNQIHLPGEPMEVPNVQFPGTVFEFIIGFFNTRIIAFSNALLSRCTLRHPPYAPLS